METNSNTSTINSGWRLAILDPAGTVVNTVALEGYDLDRPAAGIALGYEVRDALPAEAVSA